MNYWYSARPNEIFLDLDNYQQARRALTVVSATLRKRSPKLTIRNLWIYGSRQRGHYHVIIQTAEALTAVERCGWSLWLGADRLRVSYVLYRVERGLRHTDLLTARNKEYHRAPDAVCTCRGKHKSDRVTAQCPAMTTLLGDERAADYFTRTGTVPLDKSLGPVRWGRMDLQRLKQWRDE